MPPVNGAAFREKLIATLQQHRNFLILGLELGGKTAHSPKPANNQTYHARAPRNPLCRDLSILTHELIETFWPCLVHTSGGFLLHHPLRSLLRSDHLHIMYIERRRAK